MAIDIGRIAYSRYMESLELQVPLWEQLDKKHQDAWRHSSFAVLDHTEAERLASMKGEVW